MSSSGTKKVRPSHIIPILPPPKAVPEVENAVKAGERAEIVLHDGAEFGGALQKFLKAEKKIVLIIDGGAAQDIPLVKMKHLYLPQSRAWKAEQREAAGAANQGAEAAQYHVELKDGNTVGGVTLGYRSDGAGLYLYPMQADRRYTHLFIPHSSIEQYRMTPAEETHPPDDESGTEPAAPMTEDLRQADTEELKQIETPEALEVVLRKQKLAPKLRVGEILVKEGLIDDTQLNEALAMQQQYREQGKKMQLGQILADLDLVNMTDVLQAVSEKLGIPFIDVAKFKMNPEAMKYVPEDLVKKYQLLPLHVFDNKLVIALENPMDFDALDDVRFHSKLNIEPVMASKGEIERMIDILYTAPDLEGTLFDDYMGAEEEEEADDDYDESAVQDNVIVKLVNKIIIDAHQQGASDIHIEPYPGKNKTLVRIRKDGTLKHYYEVPSKMRNALIARIKIMADLDISEKRKPQDGKIDFKKFSLLKIELRIATVPTANDQEDVVMRILASGEPVPLEKLGLSEHNAGQLTELIEKPYGLFFVCGPTGSGKTTTLHSILGHLNTPERKIWTAEDPVEITQKGLRQVEVKPKIGFNFAAAMRAFLRADPDIIMVGEMRDKETTNIGIEASLTGHFVLSTLHTNSAAETVTRLLDMGMDPFNFADALVGILAQRLTKRLCTSCREPYQASEDEIAGLVAEYGYELLPRDASDEQREKMHAEVLERWTKSFAGEDGGFTLYRPTGCASCDDTGYKGRVGIHELLCATDAVKKNILEQATVSEITVTGLAEGMRTLKQDGLEKVLQGHTDAHSVRKVCIK